MVDRRKFLAHAAGQTMQHIGKADGREGRHVELDRGEQVRLVERRVETREPAPRTIETMAIDVDQGEAVEARGAARSRKKPVPTPASR